MNRTEIINRVGIGYLRSNVENEEFNYAKELKDKGIDYKTLTTPYSDNKYHKTIDIRFSNNRLSVLIETKDNYDNWNKEEIYKQLQDYVIYEKKITNNKIVAIIANTNDDRALLWQGDYPLITDLDVTKGKPILSFSEYEDVFFGAVNNKNKVIQSTYLLNELLHKVGINEKIRSQFVGTCLLALKYNLQFKDLETNQIIAGVKTVLDNLLRNDASRASKIAILNDNVLGSQSIRNLPKEDFWNILNKIEKEILPYINDKSTMGQDLLNLFFTTFNKYVDKTDKNQAFTPDHITHFMSRVVGVNRNSKVLDPCCGSGAFLVRALTDELDDCDSDDERKNVKENNIYGIENEDKCFGLSTTNMLIHGDGNSNVRQSSCFDQAQWIKDAHINIVLMNPPYNAQKVHCLPEYTKTWKSDTTTDPSKGFHYVYWIARQVKTGKMAVLLPMACAIGGKNKEICKFKELMLEDNTLDAVFSLPADIFHPGAMASACCMVFNLGTRHKNSTTDTFFGYFKDDGFKKKKNFGRVEKVDSEGNGLWANIEKTWLELYRNRETRKGLSVTKKVTAKDEWLAEAYMETDFTKLCEKDFQNTVNTYYSFLVKVGN